MTKRTLGVEEEFLLVDPRTGRPRAVGQAVLAASGEGELTAELQQEQVETNTKPCSTLDELSRQIRSARSAAAAAAADVGVALVPLATSPLPVEPTIMPTWRYAEMARRFGLTVAEGLTCGCHVHVAVDSPEEGVAVLDRIRPWLAPLLALSVNSPFWNGEDSGYRSYRAQAWQRWPLAGPYAPFGSAAAYRAFVDTALATDTLIDEGMIYIEARLSWHLPTVEVRVADVCREPDDAVLVAGLVRSLVQTAAAAAARGSAPDPVRTEVLQLAEWRASRWGMEAQLLDPRTWRPAPAAEVQDALLAHVAPALDESGDLHLVRELLDGVLRRGTGAHRQRDVMARTGDLADVVLDAVHPSPVVE
ncbi:glutamate--cysteine ligase [Pseudonocardia sp. DSM 110487]|uniref:carboxylate-amine ligase n=1 Tax=Pseudonocardia sp. DSM 110487 TaxID=2865833 RepID=UPI001C6A3802|nr:glutamate--cysteine ligase [Pseudonocardia sp. DSM 110487]QYN36418.1 glutamate--cysteine ligase [Pseudonocardia sp. DSM 110487]